MSALPPGSNGGSGHPVSHSQPADAGHGHFMNTRSPKFASITADQLGLATPEGGCCHIGPNTHPQRTSSVHQVAHSLSVGRFQRPANRLLIVAGRIFIPPNSETP